MTGSSPPLQTGCKGKNTAEVVRKVEEDVRAVLEFMASNGLVANPTKTTFLMLNHRGEEEKVKVEIGGCKIEQEGTAKLLGMKIDDDMKWSSHIKGLVSALNQRTSVLRRMKNHLNDERLKKIVDRIWTSKLITRNGNDSIFLFLVR